MNTSLKIGKPCSALGSFAWCLLPSQRVFGSQESEGKMRENGEHRENSRPAIFFTTQKKSLLQTVHRAYIMPMIRKITKTSKPQLLHRGYYRKNCKKRVKRGVKCQMGQKLESKISHSGAKILHPTALLLSLLFFCSIFPSNCYLQC